MPAYIVATVSITDPARFADYARAIAGVSESFGGESLMKGVVAEMLEGEAPAGERVVVSRFPDAAAARAYVASDAYAAARALREGAAIVAMRLIEA
jgi:uncharacterized protein (DUF1330 family)